MKKIRVVRKPSLRPRIHHGHKARPRPAELRAELKLRHDRYGELFEQSPEGIWRFELDQPIDIRLSPDEQIRLMMEQGYLAECNPAMAHMYGYSQGSDLIGLRLNLFLIPEKEENQLYLKSFIRNNYRLSDVESIEQDKQGRILHFRNNLIGVVKDQQLICAWGMQKDITPEAENREILEQSERRLRMASRAGGVGIWEWNILTNELVWSEQTKLIFGFPLSHPMTLEDFYSAIHPDDRESTAQLIKNAQHPSHGTHFVNRHRILVDGQTRWVVGLGETTFENGQAVRIIGTVIDVTEQKSAEIKATQLRDLGAQLAKAITQQQLADVIKDFALQSLHARSVSVHCVGAVSSEVTLVLAHGFDAATVKIHQNLSQNADHPMSEALLPKEGRPSARIPIILNENQLGLITLDWAHRPFSDKEFPAFLLAFADQCAQAFERTRLYEMERAARREAEAANHAKSRFLANMSHEIRTPLGAIIGFAELLAEDDNSEEDRKDCLTRIIRNGQLLGDMINDILDLSKIESEKLEVEHIDFEVLPLVQEVISLLQLKAIEKNLQLLLRGVGPLPPLIHSDPTRLRQILINLIGNAIKFTDRGQVEIQISWERLKDGVSQLRFTIEDSGLGIPASQHQRIFEPFLQADSSTTRRFGGTGLGLAVSRGLAQALGGELQLVRSAPGEGSLFAFTIDVGSPSVPIAAPIPLDALRKVAASKELAGLHILVVDDNQDNRTYISSFLSAAGARMATAANGRQAVDLALQHDYDIVLMDIQMPELDGFGAMLQLRSHNYAKPVLALTAHAMSGDRENSLKAGFQDHLVKPIDRGLLLQTIRKYTSAARKSGS